jgi:hypothetical protein
VFCLNQDGQDLSDGQDLGIAFGGAFCVSGWEILRFFRYSVLIFMVIVGCVNGEVVEEGCISFATIGVSILAEMRCVVMGGIH